jgi:hypothetical protein
MRRIDRVLSKVRITQAARFAFANGVGGDQLAHWNLRDTLQKLQPSLPAGAALARRANCALSALLPVRSHGLGRAVLLPAILCPHAVEDRRKTPSLQGLPIEFRELMEPEEGGDPGCRPGGGG